MKPPRKASELAAMRAQLQPLADAGLSTAGAALLLGVTRNTVIGRARDCGVRFNGPRPKTGGCNREQALQGWSTRRARMALEHREAA